MGNTAIHIRWSESKIDHVRDIVNKQDLIRKSVLLQEKITAQIASDAQSGFTGAVVDDLLKGGRRYAEVEVSVDERNSVSVVVANGEDAIWVEFGSGVFHNGAAGNSPHPKGQELGFIIGGYGKGMGKKQVWGFYENGELRLTHGAPARMPLYRAVQTFLDNLSATVREIWR